MRFATILLDGKLTLAGVHSDGANLVPLQDAHHMSVQALITSGAQTPSVPHTQGIAISAGMLKAPMSHPARNIFCIGKNYADHARELPTGSANNDLPAYPIVFTKTPETVIGPGDAIMINPAVSSHIDYEAELAVIIGKGGRGISKSDAMSHVWGYTIINDVTARDLQTRHGQWHLGKSQDTFCPMGPWAVTADEIDLSNTRVRAFVNGELRQDGNTREFIFDVPTLIATISAGIALKPGDIIATGTPAGVGAGMKPPRFLKDGDVVRIEIDGIGALENPVRAMA